MDINGVTSHANTEGTTYVKRKGILIFFAIVEHVH